MRFWTKIRSEKWTVTVLLLCALLFLLLLFLNKTKDDKTPGEDYVEYEKARVTAVLSDTTEIDEASDNAARGEQMLTVTVLSGQYKDEELLAYNYVGPISGVPVAVGDTVILTLSTYASGDHTATVYEVYRLPALLLALFVFFGITALIGRKQGVLSFLALVMTVVVLFVLLIPRLLEGAPTIPSTLLACIYIALITFTLLGGVHRKSVSAFLGTVCGTALAALFGWIAQTMARVNGLRLPDVEALLQIRQGGVPVGLSGLLVAGILISALGAVMDVSMSISSALEEVHAANPALTSRELFRSGMNIGRDMVGTMTNTLILAFLGAGFSTILYLQSLGLSFHQLFSSAYIATETISGIATSSGMILSIPLTAVIASILLKK